MFPPSALQPPWMPTSIVPMAPSWEAPEPIPLEGACLLPAAPKPGTSDGGLTGSDFPHWANQTHSLGKGTLVPCSSAPPQHCPKSLGSARPRGPGAEGFLCAIHPKQHKQPQHKPASNGTLPPRVNESRSLCKALR